ncbi:uncharacterized protein [Pleurodeles waltl]|uniref:uncharacterized protein n=1 Tax=Pleurodeles waltl TaxID=8319 RepID=UPI003709B86F
MDHWSENDTGHYPEELGNQLEVNLVEALDNRVQQSVNDALVRALGPFSRQLIDYARSQGWIQEQQPSLNEKKSKGKSKSKDLEGSEETSGGLHEEAFNKLRKKHAAEHNYCSKKDMIASQSSNDSDSSSTLSDDPDTPGPLKKPKKQASTPRVLDFDPTEIVHPRASNWTLFSEVAQYVHNNIRKSFDKEVQSRLRAECPRPDLDQKVTDTPDIVPTMVTFMKKFGKDPKKGLDRSWRLCQDKLLDATCPLTKILDMAFLAKESGTPMDTDVLIGWAQRSLCFLGNANCAISSERQKSILMRIDPKLTDLACSEAGPSADGLLFGSSFIKELAKFCSTFLSLDKAQMSLKKVFKRSLFARAGRFGGRMPGRGTFQSPQNYYPRGRGGWYNDQAYTTFYPTRNRGGRPRYRRGPRRGQQGAIQESSYSGSDQKTK